MSTMTRPKPSKPPAGVLRAHSLVADTRIVIRGVDWDIYDKLSNAVAEGQNVRMAYDGKDLEIMTIGNLHEYFNDFLGQFLSEIATVLAIPRLPAGQTTWKRPELARGLEADLCYYFLTDKRAAVVSAVKRLSTDIADYPNPDLAIEVDISSPEVDRPGIYAALRVLEVWRFDGEEVTIEQLQEDGSYIEVEMSRFLPVKSAEIRRWILEENLSDQSDWCRRLRTWARRLARRIPTPPRRRGTKGNKP